MTPEEKKAAAAKAAAAKAETAAVAKAKKDAAVKAKADEAAAKAKATAPKMAWRITAKVDGFRRGGMAHSATPAEYPASMFTDQQIKALKAEPMLVVEKL